MAAALRCPAVAVPPGERGAGAGIPAAQRLAAADQAQALPEGELAVGHHEADGHRGGGRGGAGAGRRCEGCGIRRALAGLQMGGPGSPTCTHLRSV